MRAFKLPAGSAGGRSVMRAVDFWLKDRSPSVRRFDRVT
jgi:hypothetical protein